MTNHTAKKGGMQDSLHTTSEETPTPTAEQLSILERLARGYTLYYYQTETESYGYEFTSASAYVFGNYTRHSVSLKDFYALVKHNWISSSTYWANRVSTTPTDGYWLTDSGKAVVLAARLDAQRGESEAAK